MNTRYLVETSTGVSLIIRPSRNGGMGVFSTIDIPAGTSLTTNFTEVGQPCLAVSVAPFSPGNWSASEYAEWQERSNQMVSQQMLKHQLDSRYTLTVDRLGTIQNYAVALVEIYNLKSHVWLGKMNGVHPDKVIHTGQTACALSNVQEFTDTGVFITTKKILAGLELIWDYGQKFDWSGSVPETALTKGNRACACQWPTADGSKHFFNGILTTTNGGRRRVSRRMSFSDGSSFAVTNWETSAADKDAVCSFGGYDNLVVNFCN